MVILLIIAGWFLLLWGYVVCMHAKQLIGSGTRLTWFWKINLLPLAGIAVLLDVAFNATVGTLLYLELPHELMFTSRCKRWVRMDLPADTLARHRYRLALWWQRQLNQISPGHV